MSIERTPTHVIARVEDYPMRLIPVDRVTETGTLPPVELTDLLERNLHKAYAAVEKAEADIARWLLRTHQAPPPEKPW